MCCSRKYPYSPHRGFFWFKPPPLWKFQFRLVLSFKNFGLQDPSPSEFPMTLCGGGMDIFWNHTIQVKRMKEMIIDDKMT